MKIFLAGGEGLTAKRQASLFSAGCRHRLISFFSGPSMERVLAAFEQSQESVSVVENEKKSDSEAG